VTTLRQKPANYFSNEKLVNQNNRKEEHPDEEKREGAKAIPETPAIHPKEKGKKQGP